MSLKELSKDYLTFSRKERISVFVIIVIITGIWLSPKIISRANNRKLAMDTSWMQTVKKLQQQEDIQSGNEEENMNGFVYDKPLPGYGDKQKGELFYFDPNTISGNEWKRLGLADKIIKTIQNYLNKGGHFYKPADLGKIYGLHADEYARLEPYVKIQMASNQKEFTNDLKIELPKEKQESKGPKRFVEINSADTTAFIMLPGIGSKLALRIINFRDKLGGFYSVDQIGETYGLADSTFQKIKQYLTLKSTEVKKININTATKDEMKTHPYLKWNLANAIVEYRTQHGNYSSLEDIKKILVITNDVFEKLKNYLTL
jgi:competence protein ComEA